MKSYRLFLRESSHLPDATRFDCQADSITHAIEQATSAYPSAEILSVTVLGGPVSLTGPVIRESGFDDYEIRPEVDTTSFWLSIGNASVCIAQREGHLSIDVYPRGCEDIDAESEVLATYEALRPSAEVLACLEPHQQAAHKRFAPTVDDLWAELGDIPVNAKDEIEVNWRQFNAGTPREDIWRWFEAKHPGFSVAKAQGHP